MTKKEVRCEVGKFLVALEYRFPVNLMQMTWFV